LGERFSLIGFFSNTLSRNLTIKEIEQRPFFNLITEARLIPGKLKLEGAFATSGCSVDGKFYRKKDEIKFMLEYYYSSSLSLGIGCEFTSSEDREDENANFKSNRISLRLTRVF
jgi:hypothetical protein